MVNLKHSHHNRKRITGHYMNGGCVNNLTVVIVSQSMLVSNRHAGHLRNTQSYLPRIP